MAENASEKPVQGGHASAAEEKKKKLNSEVDNAFMDMEGDEIVHHVKQEIFNDSKLLSSLVKNDSQSIKQEAMDEDDGRFRAAKVEMDEAIAENERLKQLLSRIVKQYQTLQTHFFQVLKQEEAKKSAKPVPARQEISSEEPELFSLSLGRNTTTSESKNDEKKGNNLSDDHGKEVNELNNEGLSLGLDCKFEPESSITTKNPSSENSVGEDQKEEEPTEMSWPPSKVLKTMKGIAADDESSLQSQLKKTRVSVRARCETPTMNDGCQWRKYGQKISKGNPCPRAYYRCTVSPNCPVRKQVQRCVQDMSILVTTYEGTHNHHLPLSATAMASTTSAAASVLQSQSSTSQPGLGISSSVSAPSSTSTSTFNGLSFSTVSHNAKPHQFYFPNSSVSTFNSHPTITLDLTGENTNTGHFSRFPYGPRYSTSTCLNFSSSSCTSLEANTTLHWNNNAAYSTYGSTVLPHSRNHVASLNSIMGRQILQEHSYQPPYMQMNNQQTTAPSQQALTETIAAATKVIASNPTFQSALAAALTSSFVGNNGGTNGARDVNPFRPEDHSAGLNLMMKLDNEPFTFNPRYPRENTNTGAVGFAASYLSKAPALNQEQGSLALFPTSLPLSMHGSSAADDQSPASGRDHGK